MFNVFRNWFWVYRLKHRLKNIPDPRAAAEEVPLSIDFHQWDFSNFKKNLDNVFLFAACEIKTEEPRSQSYPQLKDCYAPNFICIGYIESENLDFTDCIQVRRDMNISIRSSWEFRPEIKIREYEEETPWGRKLDKVALGLYMKLPHKAFSFLYEQIVELDDEINPLVLVFSFPCKRVDIPQGGERPPTYQAIEPFEWSQNPTEIGLTLLRAKKTGLKNGEEFEAAGDFVKRHEVLKSWKFRFAIN